MSDSGLAERVKTEETTKETEAVQEVEQQQPTSGALAPESIPPDVIKSEEASGQPDIKTEVETTVGPSTAPHLEATPASNEAESKPSVEAQATGVKAEAAASSPAQASASSAAPTPPPASTSSKTLTLTPTQVVDEFKRRGHFDALRKSLYNDFVASADAEALRSTITNLLVSRVEEDHSRLSYRDQRSRAQELMTWLDKGEVYSDLKQRPVGGDERIKELVAEMWRKEEEEEAEGNDMDLDED